MSQDVDNPFENPLSNKIWQRVSQIIYTKTDNINSEFFSPVDLVKPCVNIALLYTLESYNPKLKSDTTFTDNAVSGIYLFLLMSSVQVYLQERAIKTGDNPYLVRQNTEEIIEAGKNAMLKIKEDNLPLAPKEVLIKIFDNTNKNKTNMTFDIKGHKLKKKYFRDMKEILAEMGYYFAREMVIEQNIN
jgi:hypothetical protein